MTEIGDLLSQNQLLTEEVKRRVDQIAAIGTVAATVGQSLDLSETLTTALDSVTQVLDAEAAGISLIDEFTNEVVLRAQLGWIHDFVVSNPMRIPAGEGMSGQVIANDQIICHNNLDGTEQYAVPSFKKEHFRSIALAPMHARGNIIGILSIMSHNPYRFDENSLEVLKAVADTVGVAIDNARLYENTVEHDKRLEAILDSTADGIIATDRNGRISLVNSSAEKLLDIKAGRLIGIPLREADIQPRIKDQLLFALSSRNEEHRSFQVTLEESLVLSVIVSSVQVESQIARDLHMDGWLILLQDVTHLRQAEISRAQFIQAAAHDMRNPLSVTQSSVNMLASLIGDNDETVNEVIELARGGISRLQRLIDDLLQIEKIESGYDFDPEYVDIAEMAREISAEISPLMRDKSLEFTTTIDQDVPEIVSLDRTWVSRALHNYLENAYKYTQPSGEVTLSIYRENLDLHIEVIDNGPGISATDQPHLFERFFRVKATKEIKGSGLGLSIVKSVAEKHGGSVYVHSKPGHGSTFGLTLPLSQMIDID